MFTLRKRALERRAREKVLYQRRPGGDIALCLVYPNVYRLGMGNLGFQAVYSIFEADARVAADRAFLPDADERPLVWSGRERLLSFERGMPLSEFEIIAFSVSFETDYLNVLAILRMAGIPLRSGERAAGGYPLIVAGGSAVFLNPEPLADFVDLFLVGEGEEMVPEFLARYRENRAFDWAALLDRLAEIEGAYQPSRWLPSYDSTGRLAALAYDGVGKPRVRRRLVSDLGRFTTSSLILTEESVFPDMYLVEASRGCQWGCRFCAAGFMYRPIRYRPAEVLIGEASRGLSERKVIGLVGAEMASVPGVASVAGHVADLGGRLSPSSLKADCVSPDLAAALARSGNRSVTLAPEAGSERMRKVINKNLTEAQILHAARTLIGEGIESLKLYFMVGLPEEREEDLGAIVELTGKILEAAKAGRQRIGRIALSVNPFVPKPWTPFQWDPMEELPALKRKLRLLRDGLRRLGGVELDAESPREAYFQTLVSRGDRRIGGILERLAREQCDEPGQIWRGLQLIRREIAEGNGNGYPAPDFFVTRRYDPEELLPWDFIDHHVHKWFLLSERKKAHYEHQSKPCDVTRCTVCGAC